jgi:hypothetical protein
MKNGQWIKPYSLRHSVTIDFGGAAATKAAYAKWLKTNAVMDAAAVVITTINGIYNQIKRKRGIRSAPFFFLKAARFSLLSKIPLLFLKMFVICP